MSSKLFPWGRIVVILFITIFYWAGVSRVPFHPDETTQIYMSSDFELFFQDPLSLAWKPDEPLSPRMQYRLLDAPLTRMAIGFGRFLTRQTGLSEDWNWSETWQVNQANHALPDAKLLLISRLSTAWVFPLSLLLIFLIGERIGGQPAGWVSMLLFAGNSLILLHTRRAMAESLLVFTILLFLNEITNQSSKEWRLGCISALAVCAKQSTVVLFIIGFIYVFINHKNLRVSEGRRFTKATVFSGVFLSLFFLLNPFLWSHPIRALQASVNERNNLLSRQIETIAAASPDMALQTYSQRSAGLIARLFLSPPAIEDVCNYHQDLFPEASAYSNNLLNKLFTGLYGGVSMLFLTLFGSALAVRQVISSKTPLERRIILAVVLATSVLQLVALNIAVSLPFQRYSIPLVPYVCLWSAFGVTTLYKLTKGIILGQIAT